MIQITKESGVQPLRVGVEEEPTFCLVIKEALGEGPWYQDIKTYLQIGAYPENASRKDQKALRRLASQFLLSGNILYKRSFDSTLLRCVDEKEAELLMKEVHEGVCGPHMNGYMLTRKIMRQGYYWLTMEFDCNKYVRHCHLCQIYSNKINAPPQELHSLSWPFSM